MVDFVLIGYISTTLVGILLLYNYIYPRFYLDYLARKNKCGTMTKMLSFPFGIPMIPQGIKMQKEMKVVEFTTGLLKDNNTVLIEANTFLSVMTKHPENVKAVLSTQFNSFSLGRRIPIIKPLVGDGIFTAEGDHWKHSRSMLRPVFTRERVSKLEMLEEHMGSMLPAIARISDNGKNFFDMQDMFLKYTLDSALGFLFAQKIDSFSAKVEMVNTTTLGPVTTKELGDALNYCSMFLGVRRSLGRLGNYYSSKEFTHNLKVVHGYADALIEEILNRKAEGKLAEGESSFILDVAEYTTDRKLIRDQALTAFLAGRTTTASLLSHLIYELSKKPEVYQKLRNAVLSEIGSSPEDVTFETIKANSYLNWAINESLRLHPNVPVNLRETRVDVTLPRGGGPDGLEPIFVPRGVTIALNAHAMQRDPLLWGEDAEEYIPERWATTRPVAWSYIPFSGGPRICLGQQFALTEVGFVIARLCQTFQEIVPGQLILDDKIGSHFGVSVRLHPSLDVRMVPA